MDIVYFSASTLPSRQANSVHIMKMADALAGHGHTVTLGARVKDDVRAISLYYNISNRFRLLPVSSSMPTRLWHFHWAYRGVSAVGKTAPDLFYGRHAHSLLLASLRHPDVPVGYEAHTLPSDWTRHIVEKIMFRRKNFAGLVVISQALKRDYLKAFPFLNPQRILVAHDGADVPQKETIRIPLKGRDDARKICYAGRLIEGKGMGLLVEIAALCPDMDFHVFGGSDDEVAAWSARSPANMLFYGHVRHGDMFSYYAQMDVMLAPLQRAIHLNKNRTDIGRWTSPLKIFEYMAAEKPVICSDIPVLHEILEHGKTGIFCAPDNADAWRGALRALADDRNFGLALAQNAFDVFQKEYTWDARAKKCITFLMDGRGAAYG